MTVTFLITEVRLAPVKLRLANCGEGCFIMSLRLLFYFLCACFQLYSEIDLQINWMLPLGYGSDWGLGRLMKKPWALNCNVQASSCNPKARGSTAPFALSA